MTISRILTPIFSLFHSTAWYLFMCLSLHKQSTRACALGTTNRLIKINGHGDKRSSKFSNLNSINIKSAETKQQNKLKQCFPWFWFVLYCCLNLLTVFNVGISEKRLSP